MGITSIYGNKLQHKPFLNTPAPRLLRHPTRKPDSCNYRLFSPLIENSKNKIKFASFVQDLPPDVVNEVANLWEEVPETDPYNVLETEILKRMGHPDEQTIREPFNNIILGDRTPSQLLRHMLIQTILWTDCKNRW